MQRIMIIGFSGGGKSTLAAKLGGILDIAPTHLDRIHWLPGWREDTLENKRKKLAPVLARERWIIDGNYRNLYWQERLEKADTVIFLDINRVTCLYRAWRRSRVYRGKTRPDMGAGCTEKFDFEFMQWVFWKGRKKRTDNLRLLERLAAEGKTVCHLKNNRDINKFLKGLIEHESPHELVQ